MINFLILIDSYDKIIYHFQWNISFIKMAIYYLKLKLNIVSENSVESIMTFEE